MPKICRTGSTNIQNDPSLIAVAALIEVRLYSSRNWIYSFPDCPYTNLGGKHMEKDKAQSHSAHLWLNDA